MVDFETQVYTREENTIIGAEVIVYSDDGSRIGNIKITNESDYNALVARIDGLGDEFVKFEDGSSIAGDTIETILANLEETININATKLGGLQSDQFSKPGHTHTKNEITNLYNYDISLNKYNAEPGESVTVKVKVTKQNGSSVSNHVFNIMKNGVLWKSTVHTNASGVYETTFTPEERGFTTFSVGNQKVQLFAEETSWETLSSNNFHSLQRKNDRMRLLIHTSYTISITSSWRTIHTFPESLNQYMPSGASANAVSTNHIIYQLTGNTLRVATYGRDISTNLDARLEWTL